LTTQDEFGGAWTQQKLQVLGKYLHAYTKIFTKNPQARSYVTTYVDAFAGTGVIRRPALGGLAKLIPGITEAEEEFRKGSVKRALEVKPPFDKYVLIEKNARKCSELKALAEQFPHKHIEVINEDANSALLKWCANLNPRRERAVVFLDPFGTSVEWNVIAALAKTHAVDLWILFPYFAINRLLIRNRKPQGAWADRLTNVFGTADWENSFYSSRKFPSLLNSMQQVEQDYKSADHREIINFFLDRLRGEFEAVAEPKALHNTKGALLFMLIFAAGNKASAKTGIKIANSIKFDR
jgi:three-Cys-motif partner protein